MTRSTAFEKILRGVKYKKIYAWEPDKANMTALKKNTGSMKNIECVPYGLWSEEAELSFQSYGTGSSKISDSNKQYIKVKVNCIDNVCSSDKATFIKMDIEGSEMEALKGAVNVIKRDKPGLPYAFIVSQMICMRFQFGLKRRFQSIDYLCGNAL